MLSIDEAGEPIQRYTWFMVLNNISNDFNSIFTGHKTTVPCPKTNEIANKKFNNSAFISYHTPGLFMLLYISGIQQL
jgi:hypothetical protein